MENELRILAEDMVLLPETIEVIENACHATVRIYIAIVIKGRKYTKAVDVPLIMDDKGGEKEWSNTRIEQYGN